MKAVCVIDERYALVPRAEYMSKLKRLLQPGQEVNAQIHTESERSLPQHRRYFALLNEFAANIPEKSARIFWNAIIKDLMIVEQIDAQIVHELIKKIIGVKSLAFHAMPQSEAAQYHARADELLSRWAAAMEGARE